MKFVTIDKAFLTNNIHSFLNLIKNWKYSNWQEENFFYDLPSKWNFSFAIYEQNTLLGFCFASGKISNTYYIHLLFISDALRGKDIGSKMIGYAREIALKNKINKIELRCPESNVKAIDFYKKNKFEIISKLTDETSGSESDYYLQLKI